MTQEDPKLRPSASDLKTRVEELLYQELANSQEQKAQSSRTLPDKDSCSQEHSQYARQKTVLSAQYDSVSEFYSKETIAIQNSLQSGGTISGNSENQLPDLTSLISGLRNSHLQDFLPDKRLSEHLPETCSRQQPDLDEAVRVVRLEHEVEVLKAQLVIRDHTIRALREQVWYHENKCTCIHNLLSRGDL